MRGMISKGIAMLPINVDHFMIICGKHDSNIYENDVFDEKLRFPCSMDKTAFPSTFFNEPLSRFNQLINRDLKTRLFRQSHTGTIACSCE